MNYDHPPTVADVRKSLVDALLSFEKKEKPKAIRFAPGRVNMFLYTR